MPFLPDRSQYASTDMCIAATTRLHGFKHERPRGKRTCNGEKGYGDKHKSNAAGGTGRAPRTQAHMPRQAGNKKRRGPGATGTKGTAGTTHTGPARRRVTHTQDGAGKGPRTHEDTALPTMTGP